MRVYLRGGPTARGVAVALAAAALAGCGANEPPKRALADPEKVAAQEQEKRDPALVAPGSPGARVLELWELMHAGASPVATLIYDEPVREQVGIPSLSGALADQQATLAQAAPVILSQEDSELGPVVLVEVIRTDSPPARHSYILRRRDGEWRVVFDTLMHSALRAHVQSRVQNAISTSAKTPDRRAAEAGATAAERFRVAVFGADADR